MRLFYGGALAFLVFMLAAPAHAQAPDGEAVFKTSCAACHGAAGSAAAQGAPTLEALRQFSPDGILNALTNGRMQVQGATLTDAQRRAVSEFLAGRALTASATSQPTAMACTVRPPFRGLTGPSWNGWGGTAGNTRYATAKSGGITAKDLPRLRLKWAFGYAGVTAARAQPTYAGGRLFVASENGEVHSLDPKSGCAYWSFRAQAGVRTALVVAQYRKTGGGTGYAAFFGDSKGNAYAVDAGTGQQIWTRKLDQHPAAAVTGAPAVSGTRVFFPLQGLNEEGQGGRATYECCTFRGSLSALDTATGEILWKTYTIDEPKPRARNKDGVQQWGPAGGGIWSSPTPDPKRGVVYVATGNGYADPVQTMTDAVIAMDMQTGAVRWFNQVTPNDSWTLGCQAKNPDNPNCPETLGPDFDFSASPALATINRRELLVLPQKSGLAYALDPDKAGALVWTHRIGQGSGLGGQWGGAVDEKQAYFGVSDFLSPKPGGMVAVNLATGERAWATPPEPPVCGAPSRTCSPAQGGAVTVIPGAVIATSLDGALRAYAADDGSVIWRFDTNRDFDTVNKVPAKGGSMDGPGPIVVDGMMFVNSGYGGLVGRPGNVLLAFEVP